MKSKPAGGSDREIRRPSLLSAAIILCTLAGAQALPAQEAPVGEAGLRRTEAVIVTARRREESASTVPIAVTALAEDDLAKRQIRDVGDLRLAAPNLEIAPVQGNPLTASISMRGLGSSDLVPTVDPAVGLFVDGVYIGRATGANLALVDIERVEVLRGPQGALFGRNTIGGAINLIPHRPADAFEASADLRLGNYSASTLTGIFNAPLIRDHVALRIAAQGYERDGFARTTIGGSELGAEDLDFYRAQLRIGGDRTWDLDFVVDRTHVSAGSQWITLLAATPPATLVPAAAGSPQDSLLNYADPFTRTTAANRIGGLDSRIWGEALRFSTGIGATSLSLTSAQRRLDLIIENTDLDGTPYDVASQLWHEQHQRQTSHDIQLLGSGLEGRVDWIAGLYLFDETAHFDSLSSSLVPLVNAQTAGRGHVANDSRSAYAAFGYRFARAWRLAIGGRRVVDGRQLTSLNARVLQGMEVCDLAPELLDDPDRCVATLPEKEFDFSPFEVSIDYSASANRLFYGKFSRGWRAGGYNFRATNQTQALPFGPESLGAFELGAKIGLLAGRLQLDAAVFRSEYSDIQLVEVVAVPGGGTTVVTTNGGRARIDGAEIEISSALGQARLAASIGVTRPRYTELAAGVSGVELDSEFVLVPEATVSLAADYVFQLSRRQLRLHLQYSWRDEEWHGGSASARQPAYGIAGARLVADVLGHTELSVWARNLTDEKYIRRSIYTGIGLTRAIPGDPRTYGIELRHRFF